MEKLDKSWVQKHLHVLIHTALILVLSILHPVQSECHDDGGFDYRIPLTVEPSTLDPAYITDIYGVNVAVNIYDGLVEFNKRLNIVPALAKRWIISRDKKTYTFFLRKGVRFHNGREVTSDDFIYSFSRIISKETKSPAAGHYSYIKGFNKFRGGRSKRVEGLTAPGRYTLEIKLSKPFTPFLSVLASVCAKVVPKEEISNEFGKNPVGTGPFSLSDWDNSGLTLERYRYYFRGQPVLNNLHFHFYPKDKERLIINDFQKGLLEQVMVSGDSLKYLADSGKDIGRYSIPGLNLVYIGINKTIKPLNDIRVRRAILHAVDTEAIVRKISGRGSVPAKGILPPGIAGFNPDLITYKYDPKKSRELLKQAGYMNGKGIPDLEILTASGNPNVRNELLAYKEYLRRVGINLIPKTVKSWKNFSERINKKNAAMFYAAWFADYPDPDNFLYSLFHSKSPSNRTGFFSPEVDSLLDEARNESDYKDRIAIYREAEQIISDSAVIICQSLSSFNFITQPWVQGLEISYLGPPYIPLRNVRIDRSRKFFNH